MAAALAGAGSSWLSIAGWIASPIATDSLLLIDGFALLGVDKLRDLESRILPRLALLRQQQQQGDTVRIPPEQRYRLDETTTGSTAEDIVDVADYHRRRNKVVPFPILLLFQS
uniref:Uncharacterized protein n=1 Tax=Oryza punctata TaxID=4537 RepID=A0A0E0KM64_ORYPU